MPARVLIIDSVATNRIVLKVKLLAAQYVVDVCDSREEAEQAISESTPDLILLNLSGNVADQHRLCHDLRARSDTATTAIIAVGVADTSLARFAALDAGADDVLVHPINDALLLARIRGLLRVRGTHEELQLRQGTSRALGFDEGKAAFDGTASIAMVADQAGQVRAPLAGLGAALRTVIHPLPLQALWTLPDAQLRHDLFVIDASDGHGGLFGLVSDLRARQQTRRAMQMVVFPADRPEIAAMFLDLGADDVVPDDSGLDEVTLRARRLISHKRRQDKLRDTVRNGLNAAVTDPLTGLFNRRYVEPHLARLADQARRTGRDLALMMIDIDHFKAINDRYGHAAGDRVLVEIARRLGNNLRAIDMVARMGGEEFLVAMPGTSLTRARLAANRLRILVNGAPFDIGSDRAPIQVTVSVGVAVSAGARSDGNLIDAMCDQADRALYIAKSSGRNQVAMGKSAA